MNDLFTIEESPRPALELARERLAEATAKMNDWRPHITGFERADGMPKRLLKEHCDALWEVVRMEREELEKRKS